MRLLFLILFLPFYLQGQTPRTVHVFTALCDNENQGIVPVPASIGNGQDPHSNLYWGAGYGVRNYFDRKSEDWQILKKWKPEKGPVLERLLFKHKKEEVFLLADAYDGAEIQQCTEDFIKSMDGTVSEEIPYENCTLAFGGKSDLVAYTGHNGLMDFELPLQITDEGNENRDVIILACYSKMYFENYVRAAGARPLLWSTHLMSAEAYTLEWALDAWVANQSADAVRERAAQAYNHYQKCGLKGARNLLVTGW